MKLNKDILEEFKQITGKNIQPFLSSALAFFNGGYNIISAYYAGYIKEVGSTPFQLFDDLRDELEVIFTSIDQHSRQMSNLKWFILIEELEKIGQRFDTLSNINKWSRSSLTKVAYDPALQLDYVTKDGQTLERIAQDVLKNANPTDDWFEIAKVNDLTEEGYSIGGGTNVKLSFPRVNRGVMVNAVADVMIGKSIYGKDLDRIFKYDTVAEDLSVLDYDKTVEQSVLILAQLKKNENPDYPSDGLQQEIVVGTNRATLNFPIIIRQMSSTFASDDSLKDFEVRSIRVEGDALFVVFDVSTRLDEPIGQGVLV